MAGARLRDLVPQHASGSARPEGTGRPKAECMGKELETDDFTMTRRSRNREAGHSERLGWKSAHVSLCVWPRGGDKGDRTEVCGRGDISRS
jgi:hypothetical protein